MSHLPNQVNEGLALFEGIPVINTCKLIDRCITCNIADVDGVINAFISFIQQMFFFLLSL